MGNNVEIRKRMEIYLNILLIFNWISSIAVFIIGFVLIDIIREYAAIVIIGAFIIGIIGHFLINVGLAIPFILLNNGDYLAAIVPEGKIIKSALNSIEEIKEITIKEGDKLFAVYDIILKDNISENANIVKIVKKGQNLKYVLSKDSMLKTYYLVETDDGKQGYCLSYEVEIKKTNV